MPQRKRYTKEFKEETIELAKTIGKGLTHGKRSTVDPSIAILEEIQQFVMLARGKHAQFGGGTHTGT